VPATDDGVLPLLTAKTGDEYVESEGDADEDDVGDESGGEEEEDDESAEVLEKQSEWS